uniref:Uncharacterized protein n=1 Tax=Oryza rufipogon TaxID=4529 RepID=A0A0E0PLN3_ORYRU
MAPLRGAKRRRKAAAEKKAAMAAAAVAEGPGGEGQLHTRRVAQGLGCDGFKVREEKGNFFLCWQDRALFSVSAWRARCFD